MRLFFAIPLPQKLIENLAAIQTELKIQLTHSRIIWVDPTNYHITLQFIGEVENSFVPEIIKKLEQTNLPSKFELKMVVVTGFPHPKNPKTLAATVSVHPFLLALRKQIMDAVISLKLPFDQKPLRPHITLGRVKIQSEVPRFNELAFSPQLFTVQEIDLMESTLTSSGSAYRVLARFPLHN